MSLIEELELRARISGLEKDNAESKLREETLRQELNKLAKRVSDVEGKPRDGRSIFEMVFGKR